MLSNPELFKTVEDTVRGRKSFKKWTEENGEITGRVMIEAVELPDGIEITNPRDREPVAFEASFDFYDVCIGVALYTDTGDYASGLWARGQNENAAFPHHTWVSFFLKKLLESIREDGAYGSPICCLVNDTADITVVPDDPR